MWGGEQGPPARFLQVPGDGDVLRRLLRVPATDVDDGLLAVHRVGAGEGEQCTMGHLRALDEPDDRVQFVLLSLRDQGGAVGRQHVAGHGSHVVPALPLEVAQVLPERVRVGFGVSVVGQDEVPSGVGEGHVEAVRLAAVLHNRDHAQVRIDLLQVLQDLRGAVRGRVIDHDDLVLARRVVKPALQIAHRALDGLFLIVRRDEDRHERLTVLQIAREIPLLVEHVVIET